MRYEPERKTRTRERIVRNAARKVRAEGLSGPGLASVMKASGLTVGGFYKHFRSKDELLADAIAQGFSEFSEKVHSSLQQVPPEDRWKEVVRWYLSPEHCNHPATGCPVVTLAPEIVRAKAGVRKRFAGLMKELTERWTAFMPGGTAKEQERHFFVIFSAMAGAVAVSRLFPEPADRERVLASVRDYLFASF
jgi:TetR/AcrR family transcriptional regulator, transcriptional repressor for nem operon